MIIKNIILLDNEVCIFITRTEKIKRQEDRDWIIKYFILISAPIFFSFELDFIIAQKARVFTSKDTQIITHEFKSRHKNEEANNVARKNGVKLILTKVKLQI